MKRKKRPITLMEIMIVILLIGLISSVVGYNMKGSLDKGKAFKSKQGAAKIQEILQFEAIDKGIELKEFITKDAPRRYVDYLVESGLFKDEKDCLDGWGKPYDISVKGEDLVVVSAALRQYERSHKVKPVSEAKIAETETSEEG